MTGIRWLKSGQGTSAKYTAKIGFFELVCRPQLDYASKEYDESVGELTIVEWKCSIYINGSLLWSPRDGQWITSAGATRVLRQDGVNLSLRLCQEKAEKLAIKYLFGCGLVTLKALKKIGLLEEMLELI